MMQVLGQVRPQLQLQAISRKSYWLVPKSSTNCRIVTNLNPQLFNVAMIIGKAATVCARFPPPSCKRRMAPFRALWRVLLTMAFTPGKLQSEDDPSHKTVV